MKNQIRLKPLTEPELKKEDASQRPFSGINYWLMGGCILLIVVGLALMTGPGSTIEGGFNPDIFSTRRIVVGPTIAFFGFLLMAFAILWPGKSRRQAHKQPEDPENAIDDKK